jgi:hypothetical protein
VALFANPWRVFVVALVLAFVNMAAWSLATPLFASPDEPAHVARAAALVRGEIIGQTIGSAANPSTRVTVPKTYSEGETYRNCFAFKDATPASCAGQLQGSSVPTATTTYVGRYPPLYYAIVGLPSLLTASPSGVYLMRLMSALLNATFLALAVFAVVKWSSSRLLLIGLILAITPMTFFLGGVVNPSGFEITSATCVWTAGLIIALERLRSPPAGLVAVFTASTAGLLLARGLSPLWVFLTLIVLVLMAEREGLRGLFRRRAAYWALAILVPSGVFSLAWIITVRANDLHPLNSRPPANESSIHILGTAIAATPSWLAQEIGWFGWLDTRSPILTYAIWIVLLALAVLGAFWFSSLRYSIVLGLLIVVVLVVPVFISFIEARRLGFPWQGRYILPMTVGVPLTAMALLDRKKRFGSPNARVKAAICAAIGVAQFGAFAEALRRYTVGVHGPIDYLHGVWQPPLGALALTTIGLFVVAFYVAFLWHLMAKDSILRVGPATP